MKTTYVAAYKYAYLSALVVNVAIMLLDATLDRPEAYAVSLVVFAVNAFAWISYLSGKRHAGTLEKSLSLSRMAMPILAATVGLVGLVAQVSPLSRVIWVPVLAASQSLGLGALWACCAALLALEVAYFRAIRIRPGPVAPESGASTN